MKQGKYTALEILTALKIEKPESFFGKFRVRIAGIAGIVNPGHIIKLNPGKVPVIVADKSFELEVTEGENVISEAAKVSIEAKGKEVTKAANALFEAKGRPEAPKKEDKEEK